VRSCKVKLTEMLKMSMSRCVLQHLKCSLSILCLKCKWGNIGSAPVVCHMLRLYVCAVVWAVLVYVGGLRGVVKDLWDTDKESLDLQPFVLELGRVDSAQSRAGL